MRKILVVLVLVAFPANAQLSAPATNKPAHTTKIIPAGDGEWPESAYKVRSIDEEYAIVKSLGLTPKLQALVVKKGKSYDLLVAGDPATGKERDVRFDISSFQPPKARDL